MILLLLINIFLVNSVTYFLDSNVHIRIFSFDEKINKTSQDDTWKIIWSEYGHLESLAYGGEQNLWTHGTFDFKNYQVMQIDAACGTSCQNITNVHEGVTKKTLQPAILPDTYQTISAVEATKDRLYFAYKDTDQQGQTQWYIKRFKPTTGEPVGEAVAQPTTDQISAITMNSSHAFYATSTGDIRQCALQGACGSVGKQILDSEPTQIFWRNGQLWILSGDGKQISTFELDLSKTKPEVQIDVNYGGINNQNDTRLFHIPCMSITNSSVWFVVEEYTPHMLSANWTLYEFEIESKSIKTSSPIPFGRLSSDRGEPQLMGRATFLTSSDSFMANVITPDFHKVDFKARGTTIFICVSAFCGVIFAIAIWVVVGIKI